MNLIQLKYFDTVCTFGTVLAAAEALHISQPSLSAAIKALEAEFGVTLFRRGHHGMTLTKEGETLRAMSRELLARAAETEDIMRDLGNGRKVLRLGIPPMIGSLLIPQLFREFLPENPDLRLEITEGGRQGLLAKLSDELVDMVFLPHNRPIEQNLSLIHASRLEVVCAIAKNSPLSKMESVSPRELADIPLVLFEDSFFQTEEIKKRFAAEDIQPRILLQTDQLSTLTSMISNELAVGFIFRELAASSRGLAAVPLTEPMYVDVSLAAKKDAHMKDSMKRLREYVRKRTESEFKSFLL